VMFGEPVAGITEALGMARERNAVCEGLLGCVGEDGRVQRREANPLRARAGRRHLVCCLDRGSHKASLGRDARSKADQVIVSVGITFPVPRGVLSEVEQCPDYVEQCSDCQVETMRADAKKNYDQLLTVARDVVAEQGADASLRDIARRAGVGLGTLYRRFPTREALLDALLRACFDELAKMADELETSEKPDDALVFWLREAVAVARNYRGVTEVLMSAIEKPDSALHAPCIAMRAAGARLLVRAQAEGRARPDMDGLDLFALIGALAWLGDQPSLAPRSGHLFDVIAGAILKREGQQLPSTVDYPC